MRTTLSDAKAEARAALHAGDYPRALRAYDLLLSAVPHDYEIRFKIADVLTRVGLSAEAVQLYRAVAEHDIRTGHPLPAIVAMYACDQLGQKTDDILAMLASTYGSGSPHLARFAVRPSPVDPETRVETPDSPGNEPFDVVVERARRRALDFSAFTSYQQQFHPLPFFSELGPAPFQALVRSLSVRRMGEGETVMRQGEPGTALYLVASGEVQVFITEAGQDKEIARLFENTLFGEMALITEQPRSASVRVVGEADIIEVSRETLARVSAQIPAVNAVLDKFTRERLIKNLLLASPLFTPFSRAQQTELLRRFEGHDVEPGVDVIREGEQGPGLFVVLSGGLEVFTRGSNSTPVALAQLSPGDIFGEMSLLTNRPTSATVRAKSRASLLFLPRVYVERLAGAIPEVKGYFESVAAQRMRDNTVRIQRLGVPVQSMDLDVSDVLLL